MAEDIFHEGGALILGTRLRRASERLLGEIHSIYKGLAIPFEPAWFPVFFLLDKHGDMSVSELAERLWVSQSAVSQLTATLDHRGRLKIEVDESDRRRRVVALSENGLQLMERVRPVWRSLELRLTDALGGAKGALALLGSIEKLEDAVSGGSLARLVTSDLEKEDGE